MNGTAADARRGRGDRRRGRATSPAVDVALCLPATLIERAVARGARLRHRRAGRPRQRQRRPYRLHLGGDAARRRRDADHRRPQRAPRGPARERRRRPRQGRGRARRRASASSSASARARRCATAARRSRTVAAQLDASLPRRAGDAARLSIAYEPIWAIGTGKVAGDRRHRRDARRAPRAAGRGLRRSAGSGVRILYGGSVKADNAAEIFAVADVDGALVGGASLTAADFVPIIEAAAHALNCRADRPLDAPPTPVSRKPVHVHLPADRPDARRRQRWSPSS